MVRIPNWFTFESNRRLTWTSFIRPTAVRRGGLSLEFPMGKEASTVGTSSMKSRRCRFKALVKVVMKDGGDRTVGSAVSTEFTVISNQPARLAGNWSGYYCSHRAATIPVSGTIDSENQYNFIGELPFGKAKFLGKFHGNCLDADDDGTLAITGDGTAYAPSGHVWSNDKPTAAIDLDAETNAALTAMLGSWTLGDDLVGSFAINRE